MVAHTTMSAVGPTLRMAAITERCLDTVGPMALPITVGSGGERRRPGSAHAELIRLQCDLSAWTLYHPQSTPPMAPTLICLHDTEMIELVAPMSGLAFAGSVRSVPSATSGLRHSQGLTSTYELEHWRASCQLAQRFWTHLRHRRRRS